MTMNNAFRPLVVIPASFEECLTYEQRQDYIVRKLNEVIDKVNELEERVSALENSRS